MKNLYYLAVFALLAVVTTSCKDDKTDEPEVAKITVESNALTCEAGESTLDFRSIRRSNGPFNMNRADGSP